MGGKQTKQKGGPNPNPNPNPVPIDPRPHQAIAADGGSRSNSSSSTPLPPSSSQSIPSVPQAESSPINSGHSNFQSNLLTAGGSTPSASATASPSAPMRMELI